MKVFVSVDIEGVAGISDWGEALHGGPDHAMFRRLMTDEAIAAIEGARAAGATDITLRDAHETGRNMQIDRIPEDVTLIRGWSGHPYKMIQHLDDSFDALVLVGWHGAAADGGNPLSHTMNDRYAHITLNGAPLSEFLVNAHLAATHDVPVVFLAGDRAICEQAAAVNPAMQIVATKEGHGASIVGMTPAKSCKAIRAGVETSLKFDLSKHSRPRSDRYVMEIRFSNHQLAYPRSFFPGMTVVSDDTLRFEHDDVFEIARALAFM